MSTGKESGINACRFLSETLSDATVQVNGRFMLILAEVLKTDMSTGGVKRGLFEHVDMVAMQNNTTNGDGVGWFGDRSEKYYTCRYYIPIQKV